MIKDGRNDNLENSESELTQPTADGYTSTKEDAATSTKEDAAKPSFIRRGTGPRTPLGKERSKYNALKKGMFSKAALLKGESRAELEALRSGLFDYFLPIGMHEEILVDKLVSLNWRLRRVVIAARDDDTLVSVAGGPPSDRLCRCETNLERILDRTLNQLERAQRMRIDTPVEISVGANLALS